MWLCVEARPSVLERVREEDTSGEEVAQSEAKDGWADIVEI